MSDASSLRIIFAGTPDFAAVHLQALLASHHQVVAVYTQPDRPAGRGKKLQASPVKQLAVSAGLSVAQPLSLKDPDAQAQLATYDADLMIVVAYGLLLPTAVLQAPRLGCINVHASLLPRWRGAAPIQRAIEAGDVETGITLMQMDAGLDTGAMLAKVQCAITAEDNAATLHDRLAELGPPALLDTLANLSHRQTSAEAQNHDLATYAHKLSKEEAQIDWSLTATELERRIRAFNPFPVAFTLLAGERLRILAAQLAETPHQSAPGTILAVTTDAVIVGCGDGTAMALNVVQLPGKKALKVKDLLHGSAQLFTQGQRLGAP